MTGMLSFFPFSVSLFNMKSASPKLRWCCKHCCKARLHVAVVNSITDNSDLLINSHALCVSFTPADPKYLLRSKLKNASLLFINLFNIQFLYRAIWSAVFLRFIGSLLIVAKWSWKAFNTSGIVCHTKWLELLSRSRTNQIVACTDVLSFVSSKNVCLPSLRSNKYLLEIRQTAIFVFCAFQSRISRMPRTAAWIRGKEQGMEQERNSAGAILRVRRRLKQLICSKLQRSLDPMWGSIWLFIVAKR